MRCLFLIQGEGRGHLTQALALADLLRRAGHTVSAAAVGHSDRRRLPAFFLDGIGAPIITLPSPNFIADAAQRGVRLGATLAHTLARLGRYRQSARTLADLVATYRPNLLVNFYEPLGALFAQHLGGEAIPMVCVGHQYLAEHPAFPGPPGRRGERWLFRRYTAWTARHASARLALSFDARYESPAASGLVVAPPLLRPALFRQPLGLDHGFLLVYLLNHGYADAIRAWHARRPGVPLRVFWDHPNAPPLLSESPGLTFYRLDDERFLGSMARCSGLVTTAGFESVCEAMYLGKPVLAVPVEGHYEQACNALDAAQAGAGIASDTFDLDALLDFLPRYQSPAPRFRAWAAQAETRVVEALEHAAGAPRETHRLRRA